MIAGAQYPAVRLERVMPAPPHRVYRAWLDPGLIRRWMAPGYDVTKVEVDERAGGVYRVWHADHGTSVGGFECEILELVPDERIVWRWGFAGPQRTSGPVYDSQLTVSMHGLPDGTTQLTLVHQRLDDLAAALPDVAGQVRAGWASVIGKLASLVTAGEAPYAKAD
jgi:uncharacterized protein YndB with AHSA1/START domain